jgi:hypothetical protein
MEVLSVQLVICVSYLRWVYLFLSKRDVSQKLFFALLNNPNPNERYVFILFLI